MHRLRILLVADRLLHDLVVDALAGAADLAVLPSVDTLTDWAPAARRVRPDVVVVDAASAAAGEAERWSPAVTAVAGDGTAVVVLGDEQGGDGTPPSLLAAGRAGAAAWLPPGVAPDALADAVRDTAAGQALYPPVHLRALLEALRRDALRADEPPGRLAVLTARERDVLQCLVEGWSAREIAHRLDLAVNTVRTHTHRVFRKLEVHGRLEAVRAARAEGMVPVSGSGSPVRLVGPEPAARSGERTGAGPASERSGRPCPPASG